MFNGGGSNGKGALFSLLGKAMGDYLKEGKLSILTQNRSKTGSAEPEVAMLQYAHLVVFQEPSQGDQINTGVMKQYSGGEDTITARTLFKEPVTFIPRFTMAVCTNHLPDIKSDDGGTWRRMRVVEFESKFVSEGDTVSKNECKHVLRKTNLYRNNLMNGHPTSSFLVRRAWETKGKLTPCDVLKASNDYRNSQNVFAQFLDENVEEVNEEDSDGSNDSEYFIKKSELNSAFKSWYEENHDKRSTPAARELYEAATKRFGKPTKNGRARKIGWKGYRIIDEKDYNPDGPEDMDMSSV